jgi:Fic family protein
MAKLGERELEYFKNKEFLDQYIQILTSRLIYNNNLTEEDNGPIEKLYDVHNISVLNDNFNAFNIIFNKINSNDNKLNENLIIEVANTINTHSMYISNGYRKIDNDVKFENKYSIEKSDNISNAMKELLDKYYNEWSNLDIFEREALFNIEFLRIHPFEDGNGRTSRLILNYNIIRQGHAPIVIPANIREEYFHARNIEDVNYISKMFEEESKKELYAIDILINDYEKFKKNNMPFNNL